MNDVVFIVGCALLLIAVGATLMACLMVSSKPFQSAKRRDFLEEYYKGNDDAD